MQEVGRNEVVGELIAEAVMAGAYRALVRKGLGYAAGFGALADRHSANVAALAGELVAGMGLQALPRQP